MGGRKKRNMTYGSHRQSRRNSTRYIPPFNILRRRSRQLMIWDHYYPPTRQPTSFLSLSLLLILLFIPPPSLSPLPSSLSLFNQKKKEEEENQKRYMYKYIPRSTRRISFLFDDDELAAFAVAEEAGAAAAAVAEEEVLGDIMF